MNKSIIISLFCICISCNNKSLVENNYGTPARLDKIEMNIDISENTLNAYNILSSLFNNEKDFIFANNNKTHSIDIINITDKNDYGWKQLPNVNFTDSKIIYNLPIESNIYVIDIETGKSNIYGGKSKYTKNEVDKLNLPYDFEQGNRHISENVHFYELNHDPFRDVYYRLHSDIAEFDATQDFESLLNKKELYLTVFNNKFEVINETKTDTQKYIFRNCWGITSKGFFMTRGNMFYNDVNFEQFQIDIFFTQ